MSRKRGVRVFCAHVSLSLCAVAADVVGSCAEDGGLSEQVVMGASLAYARTHICVVWWFSPEGR